MDTLLPINEHTSSLSFPWSVQMEVHAVIKKSVCCRTDYVYAEVHLCSSLMVPLRPMEAAVYVNEKHRREAKPPKSSIQTRRHSSDAVSDQPNEHGDDVEASSPAKPRLPPMIELCEVDESAAISDRTSKV